MNKYMIGQKVVPHSKNAVEQWLKSSVAWKQALKRKQPFLYVVLVEDAPEYGLSDEMYSPPKYDIFHESDFEPYKE